MKILDIMYGPKVPKAKVMGIALQINNELPIPMKITKVIENETKNSEGKTKYNYKIEVEDCLDEKEWSRLIRIFFFGYQYRYDEVQEILGSIKE